MDTLTLSGVQKAFGDKPVLYSLDLCVPEHSIFGFVGRNGAGKTTTMKAILGLLPLDAGEIFVCGEAVRYGQTPTNRHIGYLPDVPAFYPFLTAREYLYLCGESLQMARRDIVTRTDELLDLVGLSQESHRIKGFSRGMKQRLGIAQALLARPKLLLCDEPTSALDPVGRKEILDLLASVKEQTTVLFSTHILSDVERICTDVAMLHDGKIAAQGTVEELTRTRGAGGFTVELATPDAHARLAAVFPDARERGENTLYFAGDEAQMHAVLRFVLEQGLALTKVERQRPSLEALFLEVTRT